MEPPLPWRATDLAVILDAEGDQVMRFGNYYDHASDDHVALAMMTAAAVNAAAGMATPPLQLTSDASEADEEDEADYDTEDDDTADDE